MKPDIEEPTVPAPVAAAADATKPKKSKIQEHHIPDDDDDDRVHPRDNWFYWVLTVLNWHVSSWLLPCFPILLIFISANAYKTKCYSLVCAFHSLHDDLLLVPVAHVAQGRF